MPSANNNWIRLTPLGGADTVTGSCYLITVTLGKKEKNYMVDCGLFTEKDEATRNTNIAGVIGKVDAIFATHAHVDHIGRLPYAYRLGYKGPIYSTGPVRALARIVLPDSARIQEQEALQVLRKAHLKNKQFISELDLGPLYTVYDAERVLEQFVEVEKGKEKKIDDYLTVCFYNAGHGLGSASIMLTLNNGEETFKLYFSGDLGQNNPILKRRVDSVKTDVDFVVMETTYAGRYHPKRKEKWKELRELVGETLRKGGNVIFPAFAVGRTQEMLYLYYKDMMETDDWVTKILRRTQVFVDSRMAVMATQEFKRFPEEFGKSVCKLIFDEYHNPFDFPQLTMVLDAESSKEITMHKNNYVVFSAAGMCNAGRVLYHLEKDLPNPNSTIIFTGYQAEGTLGRQIVDGAKKVKIGGKVIDVRAKIASINAFSGHADQNGLVKWLGKIEPGYNLFLAHGNPESQWKLRDDLDYVGVISKDKVEAITVGRSYTLYKGGFYVRTEKVELPEHKKQEISDRIKSREMERIRSFIQTIPVGCLDSDTLRLIGALESRLVREHTKAKKMAKCQRKPNRRNTGRRR